MRNHVPFISLLVLQIGGFLEQVKGEEEIPFCNQCTVNVRDETITWDEYHSSIPAASTASFAASIAAAQGDMPYTISYVDQIPIRVHTLLDDFLFTVTCCDEYTSIDYEITQVYSGTPTTDSSGRVDIGFAPTCLPTTTLPFDTEVYIILKGGTHPPVPSIGCDIVTPNEAQVSQTKTIVAQLVVPKATPTPMELLTVALAPAGATVANLLMPPVKSSISVSSAPTFSKPDPSIVDNVQPSLSGKISQRPTESIQASPTEDAQPTLSAVVPPIPTKPMVPKPPRATASDRDIFLTPKNTTLLTEAPAMSSEVSWLHPVPASTPRSVVAPSLGPALNLEHTGSVSPETPAGSSTLEAESTPKSTIFHPALTPISTVTQVVLLSTSQAPAREAWSTTTVLQPPTEASGFASYSGVPTSFVFESRGRSLSQFSRNGDPYPMLFSGLVGVAIAILV